MKDIKDLLEKIKLRNKFDLKTKEHIDRFNIFQICGVNHYENTHSAIIAELLRNDGSHNFKDKFLEAFIKTLDNENELGQKSGIDFTLVNVKVETEYPTSFGRIDILIKNDYQCIIIENKIYATDQYEQLKRYSQFAANNYNDQFSCFT